MSQLTRDEQEFISRMAVHVAAGLSFDAAAAAVITDDNRIAEAFGVCIDSRRTDAQTDCRAAFMGAVHRSIMAAA